MVIVIFKMSFGFRLRCQLEFIVMAKGNKCHISIFCCHKTSIPGSEVVKTFFKLNSADHEILTAHKYQNSLNYWIFRL